MVLLNVTNAPTEFVSPVTLNDHWSRLARLILLASLSALGSVGNVFMISAVMIEDYLRKRGNTFIVNVALADLLVSGLVVPASAVVILAGLPDNLSVCRFQWFLATLCFLVTVLSLAAIATENYYRLCFSNNSYEKLTRGKITAILVFFWTLCAAISGIQFVKDVSFDYCRRKYPGLIPYQATISVIMVFLPVLITLVSYIRAGYQVRKFKSRPSFKAPMTFNWDNMLMHSNIYSFVVFIIFWLPFGVVLALSTVRKIPNSLFYNLAWFAISKSCVNSILYGISNQHFRGAYINLFQYCCCKTTVTFSRRQRPEGIRPSGDVRVHIIPGYNMYCSPQRGRDNQSKRISSRTNGREVYEL
ncbi:melatonin receptor type 1A-like [Diabrotica undecimpunctata]|uniref:melatonin receptor type 1A-like n=1 Tax=Diabrotica undecimpunctata TaxID=50387 RepID=UPI003B63BE10